MPRPRSHVLACLFACLLADPWRGVADDPAVASPAPVDFSREILPLLSDNCFYCHGPDPSHRKAELRLDTQEGAYEVVFPGRSRDSILVERILSSDPEEIMPPLKSNKVLTPAQHALLQRWIDEGAAWGEHWSFTAIQRPPVPSVLPHAEAPVRNPIDAFVRSRLTAEGIAPSPEADRRTLIRRVTLDLTGLPPKPEDVEAFVKDASASAYEALVDRVLASSAYGERMAWDWMEVARYADSNGYQGDGERTMWPWRDWVVKAFNENLPFDQFTIWQLAGDLLPDPTFEQRLATGFNRNHPINGEGGRIPEENRVDYVLDMTETMSTGWLGLTVACARCHDHKFDPVTQKDYFSLSAFFNQTPVTGAGGNPQTAPVLDFSSAEEREKLAQFETLVGTRRTALQEIDTELLASGRAADGSELSVPVREALALDPGGRDRETNDLIARTLGAAAGEREKALGAFDAARKERDQFSRSLPRVMVMEDQPEVRPTFLLQKGLYSLPGEEVPAETPGRLPPMPADAPRNRLGLAQWLFSEEHPLTARVTVNRFWQTFFGAGLVKSAEDFGTKGELPTHPELLDWLASEFRASGWDTKALVRLLVTSHAYRQSSRLTGELREHDLTNRFYARAPRHRWPSWMLRDQALAVSGLLVDRVGGPPVRPYQPAGVWEETTFGEKKYVQDTGDALYRRSLYTFWRRIIAPTEFFDVHSRMTSSVKPVRTNTPAHALTTLNNTTYVEAARALAQNLIHSHASDDARLDHAYRRLLARPPSASETGILRAQLASLQAAFANDEEGAASLLAVGESLRDPGLPPALHAAWTSLCLALLNLDEMLNKE